MSNIFGKRTIVWLGGALFVGGTAWWLIRQKQTPSTIGDLHQHYQIEDTAAITRIVLTDKGGRSVTLTRRPDGWWVNERYPAATEKVDFLLDALKRWEVKSPVPRAARDNVVRLMTVASTAVKIYQGDRLVRKYQVGGATPDDLGTYVAVHSLEYEPYILHIPGFNGYLSVRFFTDSLEWRSLRVFLSDFAQLQLLRFEYPTQPSKSFRVEIINGEPHLFNAQGQPVDSVPPQAIKALLIETMRLHFYAPVGIAPDSLRSQTPYLAISAEFENGFEQLLLYWKAPDQRTKGVTEEGYDLDFWYALSSAWPNHSLLFQYSNRKWLRWGLAGIKWMRTNEDL